MSSPMRVAYFIKGGGAKYVCYSVKGRTSNDEQ